MGWLYIFLEWWWRCEVREREKRLGTRIIGIHVAGAPRCASHSPIRVSFLSDPIRSNRKTRPSLDLMFSCRRRVLYTKPRTFQDL